MQCALSLLGVLASLSLRSMAQAPATVCVTDSQRRPLSGVSIVQPGNAGDEGRGATGIDGCASIVVAPSGRPRGVLEARRGNFVPVTMTEPQPGTSVQVNLELRVQQAVTVTADRGLPGVPDEATSTAYLSKEQLAIAPGLALDDRLHQVAGFQLFRRTSSWTANPTTEGVSLRGLGSTAASRTLVESDEVPLNDPFGGWIHWDEIPALAIKDVVLERGGAADLYGSSAIGGVIAVEPVTPGEGTLRVVADALGATENSSQADLLLTGTSRLGAVLLAGSGVDTGGYVPTAPASRGLVDQPANVAEEAGRLEWRTPARTHGLDGFLRGNVLNETRNNGTTLQTNGTRLWRYLAGLDQSGTKGTAALRLFGDRETYRQSFSSIAATRNTETLTRLQRVPTNEVGFSLTGSLSLPHAITGGAGLDLRDIRATDAESPVSHGLVTSTTAISARQRDLGGYAEGIWQPRHWTVAGSVRADSFRTFDGRQTSTAATTTLQEPEVSELVASPHAGVVRQLPRGVSLTANGFRAFRGPTLNELYRTGQVGQQTTQANPRLLAERATGFELGAELASLRPHLHGSAREMGHLRASYFWTEVNRPISAVALSQTATSQLLQRQNLGQIRSRGLSLEAATTSFAGLDVGIGYQFAIATVTAFNTASPVQTNLKGKWIPEVPRQSVVVTANLIRPRWINLHAIVSYTGLTYDDAANQYALQAYTRTDVSADRALGHGLSLYAGAQNLFDRTIEAGRTPVLTLASPRLVQGGLRWTLTR